MEYGRVEKQDVSPFVITPTKLIEIGSHYDGLSTF